MSAWLAAFAFTQLVETPLYVLWPLRDRPLARALPLAFAASALTHPIVWFVMPHLVPGDYWTMVAVAEVFAVTAEAGWLRLVGVRRPWLPALLVNAASLGLGLMSRWAFGWP